MEILCWQSERDKEREANEKKAERNKGVRYRRKKRRSWKGTLDGIQGWWEVREGARTPVERLRIAVVGNEGDRLQEQARRCYPSFSDLRPRYENILSTFCTNGNIPGVLKLLSSGYSRNSLSLVPLASPKRVPSCLCRNPWSSLFSLWSRSFFLHSPLGMIWTVTRLLSSGLNHPVIEQSRKRLTKIRLIRIIIFSFASATSFDWSKR